MKLNKKSQFTTSAYSTFCASFSSLLLLLVVLTSSLVRSEIVSSYLFYSNEPETHAGTFNLSLGYSPALSCEVKKVELAYNAVTSGAFHPGPTTPPKPVEIRNEMRSSLRLFTKEVKKAKLKYEGDRFSQSSGKVRDLNMLRTCFGRVCTKLGVLNSDIVFRGIDLQCDEITCDLGSI